MRIVRNATTDALRKRRSSDTSELSFEWADPAGCPVAETIARERHARVALALERLPEKFRTPLVMHYSLDRTVPEIAVALDLPASTVTGRVASGLRLLRDRMRKEGLL